jgi:hypothetical protein
LKPRSRPLSASSPRRDCRMAASASCDEPVRRHWFKSTGE